MIDDHLKRSILTSLRIFQHINVTRSTFITTSKNGSLPDVLLYCDRLRHLIIEYFNFGSAKNFISTVKEFVFERCTNHLVFGNSIQLRGDASNKFNCSTSADKSF